MFGMNICYSGAAKGADTVFGVEALEAGHEVIHFVHKENDFWKARKCTKVLSPAELYQADEPLTQANKILKRKFPTRKPSVDNLLRRNFWQIKDTERVYAVASLEGNLVKGGTGWAVQMAIDRNLCEIYVFDLNYNDWFFYDHVDKAWIESDDPPEPYGRYTGIGSREITPEGIEAVRNLYASN